MRITVVGTGYVGLVTGTCFAEAGNHIICVDIDEEKVAKLKGGRVPIYEPGLEELFKRNIENDRLKFTTNLKDGIDDSDLIFMCLPTPPGEDGFADLSYVLLVAGNLAKIIKPDTIIVNKSTVPIGTTAKVRDHISRLTSVGFDVISNPEFLREGHAIEDFQKPDRVVVGTVNKRSRDLMSKLYGPFVSKTRPVYFMDERSAEMTKYAANTFLAAKISFMNELANLCELVDADIDLVRQGIGSDARIGSQFLFAGIGYGGSCFPKDVSALNGIANENEYDFKILKALMQVNLQQKRRLVEKLKEYYGGGLSGKKIAIWGLAFKPDTDDIRETPALEIIKELSKLDVDMVAYDPEAMPNFERFHGDTPHLSFAKEKYEAVKNADALLILTEWEEFRTADPVKIKAQLRAPVIFDGRNVYGLNEMQANGFYYNSIGRRIISK